MSSSDTDGHWTLPFDIIVEVIKIFWLGNHSNAERIQFIISSTLVNTLWRRTFLLISYKHAFVSSPRHADEFIRLVTPRDPLPPTILPPSSPANNSDLIPRNMCRSVRVLVENGIWPHSNIESGMGDLPNRVLAILYNQQLPHLRHVCLEYSGITLYQIAYLAKKRIKVPSMDIVLDIRWNFSHDALTMVTRWIEEEPGRIDGDTPRRWMDWRRYVASIRHMSVQVAGVPLHEYRGDSIDLDVVDDWAPYATSQRFMPLPTVFKHDLLGRMFDTRI